MEQVVHKPVDGFGPGGYHRHLIHNIFLAAILCFQHFAGSPDSCHRCFDVMSQSSRHFPFGFVGLHFTILGIPEFFPHHVKAFCEVAEQIQPPSGQLDVQMSLGHISGKSFKLPDWFHHNKINNQQEQVSCCRDCSPENQQGFSQLLFLSLPCFLPVIPGHFPGGCSVRCEIQHQGSVRIVLRHIRVHEICGQDNMAVIFFFQFLCRFSGPVILIHPVDQVVVFTDIPPPEGNPVFYPQSDQQGRQHQYRKDNCQDSDLFHPPDSLS